MVQARKPGRVRPVAKSLKESLGEFLTPAVLKQVRKTAPRRKMPRWDLCPLLFVLLISTWCCGDSQPEKFEAARGFYVLCHPKRRRPGQTFAGFQQAVERLPMFVLRSLATALRHRLAQLLGNRWTYGGFVPIGCDGSRLECPRTTQLEGRLGQSSKQDSAPTIWVTAMVHLVTGVPWAWRWGKGGKASERAHLLQLLPCLPAMALVVADAGYYGYELLLHLTKASVWFLIRMSSNVTLYREDQTPLEDFREGIVYYWPDAIQKKAGPPVQARLLRVRDRKRKVDVWLLTNVLSSQALTHDQANQLYRWRWENEGYFRTYKRTMAKLKLACRTIRQVHREAEASMIATQLLMAEGVLAMPATNHDQPRSMCSPRKVILEIRREMHPGPAAGRSRKFTDRLKTCCRESRRRVSPKAVRVWPRRKPHKPPGPPEILTLTATQKSLISRCFTPA